MPANKFSAQELAELDKLDKDIASMEDALKGSEADLALLLGSTLPPPAGTAADVISLGKSIGTGDWGGAFWDAVGLVPVVGDAAKGAVKGTKLANKIADIKKALKQGREKIANKRKTAEANAKKKCDETKKAQASKEKDKGAAENCAKGNCGAEKLSKQEQIKANKKKGDDFAKEETENFKKEANKVENEITIKAKDGTKTRVDAIGVDEKTGSTRIQEYKGSDTAPLTKNQEKAFPQLEKSGGEVVGKGKGDFTGGTKIPPTKIEIIRPPKK